MTNDRQSQLDRMFNTVLSNAKVQSTEEHRENYLRSCENHGGDMVEIVNRARENFGGDYSI